MATPNEILDGNGCFSCLPENQLLMLQAILLYQISGSMATPSELLAEGKCFACLTPEQLSILQTILLSQIAENSGNASGAHFKGSGSPEGVVTADVGDIYYDTMNFQIYYKMTGDNTNTGWQ